MNKKQKLNLASWGDLSFPVEINKCKKCDRRLEHISAMGVVAMAFCKICKKFYGLEITDITSRLLPKFKKNILTGETK